jgi:hypothetical protein
MTSTANHSEPRGRRRWAGRLAAACALPLAVVAANVAPASAATNSTSTVSIPPSDNVVATCAGGVEIGLGFEITRREHHYYDADGNEVRMSRNLTYTGTFENLSTGQRYTFQGTRNVTFDWVANTFTGTGNFRTVTQPGVGLVLHYAGRDVASLLDDSELFSSGPRIVEWDPATAEALCGLYGLHL